MRSLSRTILDDVVSASLCWDTKNKSISQTSLYMHSPFGLTETKNCSIVNMKCRMNRFLLLLLAVLIFVSCRNDSNDLPIVDATAERTVLVWLAGDNNLSSEIPRKINALAQGYLNAKQEGVRLLIYSDCRGDYPQLIEIVGQGEIKKLATYPAHNSASPETFHRMLSEMIAQAPAKHYGLILFSHATGWLPKGALEHPADFDDMHIDASSPPLRTIFDDNGEQMSIVDFAKALPTPGTGKFDYIVFENCFTAGIEIAYELRDKADRLLVSSAEILSPGFEVIYTQNLGLLMQSAPDLVDVARAYYHYRNAMNGNNRSATVSVVNTAAIGSLTELVCSIEAAASPLDENILPQMQRFNRHRYALFFDLAEYLEMRSPDRAADIQAAIDGIVEYSACTPSFIPGYAGGFNIRRHCGITTYIPQSAFPALNAEYYKQSWYKATH